VLGLQALSVLPAAINQTLDGHELAATQNFLFIGLRECFLNACIVGFGNLHGNAYWNLTGFDCLQKALFSSIE
jgi:hypothetical protein